MIKAAGTSGLFLLHVAAAKIGLSVFFISRLFFRTGQARRAE
jgi:hypothetical protein